MPNPLDFLGLIGMGPEEAGPFGPGEGETFDQFQQKTGFRTAPATVDELIAQSAQATQAVNEGEKAKQQADKVVKHDQAMTHAIMFLSPPGGEKRWDLLFLADADDPVKAMKEEDRRVWENMLNLDPFKGVSRAEAVTALKNLMTDLAERRSVTPPTDPRATAGQGFGVMSPDWTPEQIEQVKAMTDYQLRPAWPPKRGAMPNLLPSGPIPQGESERQVKLMVDAMAANQPWYGDAPGALRYPEGQLPEIERRRGDVGMQRTPIVPTRESMLIQSLGLDEDVLFDEIMRGQPEFRELATLTGPSVQEAGINLPGNLSILTDEQISVLLTDEDASQEETDLLLQEQVRRIDEKAYDEDPAGLAAENKAREEQGQKERISSNEFQKRIDSLQSSFFKSKRTREDKSYAEKGGLVTHSTELEMINLLADNYTSRYPDATREFALGSAQQRLSNWQVEYRPGSETWDRIFGGGVTPGAGLSVSTAKAADTEQTALEEAAGVGTTTTGAATGFYTDPGTGRTETVGGAFLGQPLVNLGMDSYSDIYDYAQRKSLGARAQLPHISSYLSRTEVPNFGKFVLSQWFNPENQYSDTRELTPGTHLPYLDWVMKGFGSTPEEFFPSGVMDAGWEALVNASQVPGEYKYPRESTQGQHEDFKRRMAHLGERVGGMELQTAAAMAKAGITAGGGVYDQIRFRGFQRLLDNYADYAAETPQTEKVQLAAWLAGHEGSVWSITDQEAREQAAAKAQRDLNIQSGEMAGTLKEEEIMPTKLGSA